MHLNLIIFQHYRAVAAIFFLCSPAAAVAAAAAEHSKECKRPKWQHFFLYVLLCLGLCLCLAGCVWYSSVVVAVDVVYATRSFAQAKRRRHLV